MRWCGDGITEKLSGVETRESGELLLSFDDMVGGRQRQKAGGKTGRLSSGCGARRGVGATEQLKLAEKLLT